MSKRYMGLDLGRRHDSTAIVILEVGDDKGVRVVGIKELKGVPFEAQIAEVGRLVKKHDIRLVAVDETGMGIPIAERLRKELPGVIEPVTFTQGSKAELVTRGVSLLQDQRIRIPKNGTKIRDQLHSIAREITPSGNIVYRPTESDSPDLAWALLLGIHAARSELLGESETLGIATDSDRRIIDTENPEKYLSGEDKMSRTIARGFAPPPPIIDEEIDEASGGRQWPITTQWGYLVSREWVYLGPTDQTTPVRVESLKDSDPERYAGLKAELKSRGLIE